MWNKTIIKTTEIPKKMETEMKNYYKEMQSYTDVQHADKPLLNQPLYLQDHQTATSQIFVFDNVKWILTHINLVKYNVF